MENYKRLSEYDVRTVLSMTDLFPTLVDNGDGTYSNKTVPLSAIRSYSAVPAGGSAGQFLKKQNATDYATQWANPTKADVGLGNVDNTSDTNKPVSTATQAAIDAAVAATKQALYPVGSLYFNATNNTNPGTLLGFGTWVAYAAGRVPVGFDATQTEFDTAEETGGNKTRTLTQSDLPNVQGSLGLHGGESGSIFPTASGVFAPRADIRSGYKTISPTAGSQSLYYNVNFDLNAGTQTPVSLLQPYITVYIWKRTA